MKHFGVGALALVSACAAAQNVDHLWAASTNGEEQNEIFNDLVRDGKNNVYTVGTQAAGDGQDVVITRTREDGRRLWTRKLNLSRFDFGRAIALRSDGTLIIAGSTGDGQTTRLLLAAISTANKVLWTREISNGGLYDSGHDVQLADDGSIIVAGSTAPATNLLDRPFVARYNENGTTRKWYFDLPGGGTARHLVLGDNRVYYAGERRTIPNELGLQVLGDAFVGRCSLSTGGSRNTESVGGINATYERIHQLAYAGKNRVIFCGWQGLTPTGDDAEPIYGMLKDGELSYTVDSFPNTVASDIAYDARTDHFAVTGTSIRGNTTQAYVKVGTGTAQGGFNLGKTIFLPGDGGFAHSIGFTPDGYWTTAHATDDGGILSLGDQELVAVSRMPRLSLGWNAVGIPSSEHPPKDYDGTMFWYAGDNASGARVAGNEYLPGPEDTLVLKEDRTISRDVVRNDGTKLLGERSAVAGAKPKHGTATYAAGTLTYIPDKNFSGTDSFTYRLFIDGRSVLTVPVSVVVTAVNDVPTAQDKEFAVSSTKPTLLRIVSGNEDPDVGDRIVIDSFTQPKHGTVEARNAGKDLLFTPEKGFTGTLNFNYTLQDKFGRTSIGTIRLRVQ